GSGELNETRVIDIVAHRLPEVRDEALGDVFPIRLQGLRCLVEEHVPELVATNGEAGRECSRERVGGEYVEVAPFDIGRLHERIQQFERSRRHRLIAGDAPAVTLSLAGKGE